MKGSEIYEDIFLRIRKIGENRIKFVEGGPGVNGAVYWVDDALILTDADGIYLRKKNGLYTARFRSLNFQPTGGREMTYTVTVKLLAGGKLEYTRSSGGRPERFTAVRCNSCDSTDHFELK